MSSCTLETDTDHEINLPDVLESDNSWTLIGQLFGYCAGFMESSKRKSIEVTVTPSMGRVDEVREFFSTRVMQISRELLIDKTKLYVVFDPSTLRITVSRSNFIN